MEEGKEIVKNQETLPEIQSEDTVQRRPSASTVQSRMEELIPYAGTIEITEEQKKILFAPVNPELVEIRPDGLVYLPWPQYVERLRDAFGLSWAIIPRAMPKLEGGSMYWAFYLMIQGKLAGFAIGEQAYQANNPQMSYSDASEGAKSNSLMRLCKGIGISLELWKPSFIRAWKAKYAESFPATWPDGKPKLDKNGKQKVEWRKKGITGEERIEPEPEPEQTIPIITSIIDKITQKDGVKDNKPYIIYTLHIGDQKITTFSETFAKTAKEFMTKKEPAVIEYKITKYGMELIGINPKEENK